MPFTPRDSNIQFTPEQIAEINACERPDQIQPLLEKFMIQNGQAAINADGVPELVIGPTPRKLGEVLTLPTGEKHVVEVDAELGALGLAKAVTEFYKSQASGQQPQKRDANGKFIADSTPASAPAEIEIPDTEQEMIVALAEARQKVQLGTLTAEEFLELKQTFAADVENNRQWSEAVEVFRNSEAGSDWVGGEDNMRLVGSMLQHLDMVNGEEVDTVEKKTAILTGLWQKLKDTGNYFERQVSPAEIAEKLADEALQDQVNEEYEKEIAAAKTASEIAEVNTRYGLRPTSSSLFER